VTTNGSSALIDDIRKAYAEAESEGHPRPGRPALVKMLANPPEITPWQVRKAKELVDAEDASPPAPTASETPAAASAPAPDTDRPLVLWPVSTAHRLAATNQRIADVLETASSPAPPPATRQPATSPPRPWPLALIGLAAAVAVWSGWVGLGQMAGFGVIQLLPGIWDDLRINSAVVLPISVEAYAAYALRVWLSTSWHSQRTVAFARFSSFASLAVGGAAQVAYHVMAAAGYTRAPWWVTMLVSLVPVAVLGLASALAKLVKDDRQAGGQK
jgi:hypothetical protein